MTQRHTTLDVRHEATAPAHQTADGIQLDAPTARIPGGFWRRVAAVLLDGTICSILTMPITFVLGVVTGLSGALSGADLHSNAPLMLLLNVSSYVVSCTIVFVYYGWFYKHKGATPGKMLLRLQVASFDTGTHLTYWKAFGRETLGKMLSGMLLGVGFLMVAFRRDKRGLHDMLWHTQVTYEPK